MTIEELTEAFERHSDEYIEFDRIKNPVSRRPDLCGFIMLDAAVPPRQQRGGGISDMVCASEHDEIWLDVSLEDLAAVATDDLIRDLVRCGVRCSEEHRCLVMFT